jgi:tRNA threonylcarbamoyladenosine biosynthesis protein TsaE
MQRSTMPAAAAGRLRSSDPEHTRAIGHALGRLAHPGTLLALHGELGAGKTQLAKGVAQGLGVTSVVNSPTFVLMNEHAGRLRLYHVDAYRLDGVTVIEWADRLAGWLPADRLEIHLADGGGGPSDRSIAWQAWGVEHERLAREALDRS